MLQLLKRCESTLSSLPPHPTLVAQTSLPSSAPPPRPPPSGVAPLATPEMGVRFDFESQDSIDNSVQFGIGKGFGLEGRCGEI